MMRLVLSVLGACLLAVGPVSAQPVTQPFTFNVKSQNLPAVRNATVTWADIDNDGDLDALVSGRGESGLVGGIWRNEGSDAANVSFVAVPGSIRALAYSRAAWTDMDGDGDLDLALTGSARTQPPYEPVIQLYRNDGGTFAALDSGALPALHSGALAWGDVDNDGDADLLVTGQDAAGEYVTRIVEYDAGVFRVVDPGLPGFAFADAKWGDYDNDGDADLLISGATPEGFRTRIYANQNGTLTDSGANLTPLAFSSVDWGDYDADGDLDVVVSGGQVTPRIFEGTAGVYRNDNGSFSRVDLGVDGVLAGAVTWGDYDNDGDLDLLSLGAETALGRRTARVYRLVDGQFENSSLLVGAIFASADWGDFDGDGDLDLLTSGATSYGVDILNLYENNRQVIPGGPATPLSARASVEGNRVTLEWAAGDEGLVTYDVRIGTRPGSADVRSVPADPASGQRRLGRPGTQSGTMTFVQDLPPGTYYWSVQAVGPAFLASGFAQEGTFDVTSTATSTSNPDLPSEFALESIFPNPFAASTSIRFDVPTVTEVDIRVFDVLGRQVAVLEHGASEPGYHTAEWRATTGLAGGVYFIRMRAGTYLETRPVTLVR
ncbi:MAG: T9SS type A sorting domain-containing protein [Rhodothermales bacterium]|nr:T9SS type A sorting domain-containing protein [Rhodothermales bacterium]